MSIGAKYGLKKPSPCRRYFGSERKTCPRACNWGGPDLVLIHAVSGNLRDYTTSIASELANSHRVIIFDRTGLGHSERITNVGYILKDLTLLLRDAALMLGAERPIIWGIAMGVCRLGLGVGGAR